MKKIKKYFIIVLFPIISILYPACDKDTGAINIFSDSDDVELGKDVSNEIKNNPAEYPVYTKVPSIKSYIDTRIFQQILSSSKILKKSTFDYKIEIIEKDSVLNAFALPGGNVYIFTGLLKYLDSEAALAGVLGHEIAHAERRHATNRMTTYYGVSILLSIVLGDKPSQIAEIAANLFVGLAFLANSRADEDESDQYSIEYLKDTRYYPGGVKFFFEKMKADGLISSNSSSIATFLSTHPDPVERINSANQRLQSGGIAIKNYTSSDADVFRNEYKINILDKIK